MSWTSAGRPPTSRLNSVDLPTFGRPTMATSGVGHGVAFSAVAEPAQLALRRGSTPSSTLTNSDRCTGLPSASPTRLARGDAELADARARPADDDRLLRVALDDDHRADRDLALAVSVQVSTCTAHAYGSSLPSW